MHLLESCDFNRMKFKCQYYLLVLKELIMSVIKRDGRKVDFDKQKIIIAIGKAQHSLLKDNKKIAESIAEEIAQEYIMMQELDIKRIEKMVFDLLVKHKQKDVARAYEAYRAVREYRREHNTSDKDILGLLDGSNIETIMENSNKNAKLNSTLRDLIAGEVNKDLAKRKVLPPEIVDAHNNGIYHYHDLDYAVQPNFNCCVFDLKDMLDNGTVINGNMVETPKSFQVACTVTTQVIQSISSGQYGGQSVSGIDEILAPYLKKSYDKYLEFFVDEKNKEELAHRMMMKELKDGIQTIQYQILTLAGSNGQSPFVTLGLYFNPDGEYADYAALICEEILKQRYAGVKNSDGILQTPVFPKLIYMLDEYNAKPGSKYYYLTKLAAKCTARRMYPDFISAKIMREQFDGELFFPMG